VDWRTLYPVGYRSGARYPLVIQNHGFAKERFWIDGAYSTALLRNHLRAGLCGSPGGGRRIRRLDASSQHAEGNAPRNGGYEAAIDLLARRGLIARERVGLIGFSRTAGLVEYTLTHSGYDFSAAIVADGVDFSYVQYMLFALPADYEAVNGGLPFGPALAGQWLSNAPGFNIDKMRTPCGSSFTDRTC